MCLRVHVSVYIYSCPTLHYLHKSSQSCNLHEPDRSSRLDDINCLAWWSLSFMAQASWCSCSPVAVLLALLHSQFVCGGAPCSPEETLLFPGAGAGSTCVIYWCNASLVCFKCVADWLLVFDIVRAAHSESRARREEGGGGNGGKDTWKYSTKPQLRRAWQSPTKQMPSSSVQDKATDIGQSPINYTKVVTPIDICWLSLWFIRLLIWFSQWYTPIIEYIQDGVNSWLFWPE